MADNSLDPNVSTGDWILTFFLSAIPLVGIIMMMSRFITAILF